MTENIIPQQTSVGRFGLFILFLVLSAMQVSAQTRIDSDSGKTVSSAARLESKNFGSQKTEHQNSVSVVSDRREDFAETFRKISERMDEQMEKREAVKERLLQKARIGTESGGGGSLDRERFYQPLSLALSALENYSHRFGEIRFDYELLALALRAVTILPTHEQLRDRFDRPVDFYNDPDVLTITYNVARWKSLSEIEKYQFGFHELFGVLRIPDPRYDISRVLALAAQEALNEKRKNPKPITVVTKLMPGANPLQALADYSHFKAQALISNDCEKYEPGFKGQCIVAENGFDGITHLEILLIDPRLTHAPTLIPKER